jgi:transposase-like protein
MIARLLGVSHVTVYRWVRALTIHQFR